MKTVLIWYLVTVGYNSANITWSPPITTLEECQRVQKLVYDLGVGRTRCIQFQQPVVDGGVEPRTKWKS